MRRLVLSSGLLLAACARPPEPSFLEQQLKYLHAGVDLGAEEKSVRQVLAQRHLYVKAEVRGPAFIALGAATLDERLSAARVITPRGVVVAEDAAQDDLFAPASLRLDEDFPPSLGEYELVVLVRTPAGRDQGCAGLFRILPDGSSVPAILDVGALGTRACVAGLARAPNGRLAATIAFPGLFAGQTPTIQAELGFQSVLVGREAPLIPVAKLEENGAWLEQARASLEQPLPGNSAFAARHAVGVGRAALALLSGKGTREQMGIYREVVGRVVPGSAEGETVADTLKHIQSGWLDDSTPPNSAVAQDAADAMIVEPPPVVAEPDLSDAVVVEAPPVTEASAPNEDHDSRPDAATLPSAPALQATGTAPEL